MKTRVSRAFDYSLDFEQTSFRAHPELYRIGTGEQGVLLVQPYKDELLPHWRFKNPEVAQQSAQTLYQMFEDYLNNHDFVGADMARKFIQMGYTRARRYANYKGGRKYQQTSETDTTQLPYPYSSGSRYKKNPTHTRLPDADTSEKAQAAAIFKTYWDKCRIHPDYLTQKEEFIRRYYDS